MRIISYLIWFDWLVVVSFCMQESYITTGVMVARGSTSFCMEGNCHDCHRTRVSCKKKQQLSWLSHGGVIDRMGWQTNEPSQFSHQNDVHTLFFLVVGDTDHTRGARGWPVLTMVLNEAKAYVTYKQENEDILPFASYTFFIFPLWNTIIVLDLNVKKIFNIIYKMSCWLLFNGLHIPMSCFYSFFHDS